ncbi:hypothetical protein GCM10023086_76620 [Streptomyces venetus]|uniref:Uncharacterized protein n=1 Tax=Streptomyces venetus TaxID=1701086 RepID=A0ABP8HKZ3_9ACTN
MPGPETSRQIPRGAWYDRHKREDREPPKLQEPESKPGQVVDLMAALHESVQQARASRGEDADVHEMPKKKTAKKQPA